MMCNAWAKRTNILTNVTVSINCRKSERFSEFSSKKLNIVIKSNSDGVISNQR